MQTEKLYQDFTCERVGFRNIYRNGACCCQLVS